jgi:hypothetical protein
MRKEDKNESKFEKKTPIFCRWQLDKCIPIRSKQNHAIENKVVGRGDQKEKDIVKE